MYDDGNLVYAQDRNDAIVRFTRSLTRSRDITRREKRERRSFLRCEIPLSRVMYNQEK